MTPFNISPSQPSCPQRSPFKYLSRVLALTFATTTGAFCATSPNLSNIDSSLQKLSAHAKLSFLQTVQPGIHASIATVSAADKKIIPGRFDSSDRVLVHIHLNGHAALGQVSTQVLGLKGNLVGTKADYRHGIIAAYLPTDQLDNAAKIIGVRALTMEHPPQTRVGTYTSQSASVLQTDVVNKAGLKGDGITVGVISSSFNTAYETAFPPATTATQDVASGDLPVVNVLEDFPDGSDEGRAMCQIVYDEAPHCQLAFATADVSEVDFANNISLLRTEAGASVIVDDVGYLDEPVFSDGIVAQAVNTVATSTTIPGKPAVYVSSAGNDGNNGYRSPYRNLTDAQVRKAGGHGNLKLNVTDTTSPNYLDPSLTAGGWFNWNSQGGSEPSTTFAAPGYPTYGYLMLLQWDDLFDQDDGITTGYNLLVFDANGNYLSAYSGTTNAFSVQEPIQAIGYLALGTQYQIAITRIKQTDPLAGPIPATHQLALYTTLDGASTLLGKYFSPAPLNVPNIYGHPNADGAIAVAAYDFSWRAALPYAPELENFSSPGPSAIYFDANNKRLATPDVRLKPEVAGTDGVVTTFFGSPYYNSPFAFFGTSAAAPSVAGVAALMIQGAGGPGSISPAIVKQDLEASGQARNSTVEMTQASGSDAAGTVTVSALGQTYFGPNYMTVTYTGVAGDYVRSLTIDGTAAGLTFNTTEFFLGTLSGGLVAGNVTVVSPSASTSKFTLQFKKGTFKTGASFGFSIGQDYAGTFTGFTQNEFGAGVEAEDLAFGATSSATFGGGSTLTLSAPFKVGTPVTGYSPADGYGLINAVTAVGSALPVGAAPLAP